MDNTLRSAVRYWLSTGDFSVLSQEQAETLHTLLEKYTQQKPVVGNEKTLKDAPLRSAERERACAVSWNRAALVLSREGEYWKKRALSNEQKREIPALSSKPLINEHGYIVVEAIGSLRPYLWISRNFSSCGDRSDGIGFVPSSAVNDSRPHEGGWSISWEELRTAVMEIHRSLEERGDLHKDHEQLRKEFEAMMGTWGTMPAAVEPNYPTVAGTIPAAAEPQQLES